MVFRSWDRLATWFERHPRITLVIAIVGLCSVIVWEIVRISGARHTVRNDWATGVATGITASLAMTAVLIFMYRVVNGPGRHGGLAFLVTLLIAISPAVAFVFTAPQPGAGSVAPYAVTTGAAVAGMAYTATFFALY